MTTEDLDCIDHALGEIPILHGFCAGAKGAALRFNSQVQLERARCEDARATHDQAGAVSPDIEIELRAAAVMYSAERERIASRWGILLGPRFTQK